MRRLVLFLALALSLSALTASSAPAGAPKGAQKAPLYGPEPSTECKTGAAPTPHTFGFAILETTGNGTTLSGVVSLKGATPNATYLVDPVEGPTTVFGCAKPTGGNVPLLHTNARGNGTVEFSLGREPGTTTFFVELVNLGPPGEEFASPAVRLD